MTCQHHWIYETANGKKSKGICKFCGAEREDTNSFEEAVKKTGVSWNNRHYPKHIQEKYNRIAEVYNRK